MPTPPTAATFALHGREYQLPAQPIVAMCIDGCADAYLDAALATGHMPQLAAALAAGGTRVAARGCMPSFTNVNNAAIVCGAPPAVTGIGGNYFIERATGEAVMMNDPEFLRAETILAAASVRGRKVAMITAKDKLRRLLTRGMSPGSIVVSAERADEATVATHGIAGLAARMGRAAPAAYSADLSLYALELGAALLEAGESDLLYLTTSDWVQHKHAPDEPEALAFMAGIDRVIGRCVAAGARVGLTADHGMNQKERAGAPRILWLERALQQQFGGGVRVVCTITDPYVAHHGALGGWVEVHLPDRVDPQAVIAACLAYPEVDEALPRERAAARFELPADRMGDVVVTAVRDAVLGRTPEAHDLADLGGRLRTHGSRYEEHVPFVLTAPVTAAWAARLRGDIRSFDLFDALCHGATL